MVKQELLNKLRKPAKGVTHGMFTMLSEAIEPLMLLNPGLVYILDCLSNHKWLGVRNWVTFSLCGHSFEGAHHPVISKPKTLHGCHMLLVHQMT